MIDLLTAFVVQDSYSIGRESWQRRGRRMGIRWRKAVGMGVEARAVDVHVVVSSQCNASHRVSTVPSSSILLGF